jgi:aarF domain-containing kinase
LVRLVHRAVSSFQALWCVSAVVQVQRPGLVEAIGRDTFILRNLAAIARRQLKLNTDLPALVDEWAASLFKELDYRRCAGRLLLLRWP